MTYLNVGVGKPSSSFRPGDRRRRRAVIPMPLWTACLFLPRLGLVSQNTCSGELVWLKFPLPSSRRKPSTYCSICSPPLTCVPCAPLHTWVSCSEFDCSPTHHIPSLRNILQSLLVPITVWILFSSAFTVGWPTAGASVRMFVSRHRTHDDIGDTWSGAKRSFVHKKLTFITGCNDR